MMTATIQIDTEVKKELEKKAYELGLVFSTPNEVLRIVFNLEQSSIAKSIQAIPKPVDTYQLGTTTDSKTESRPTPAKRQKIGSKLLREHPHIAAKRGYFSSFLPAGNTPYQFPAAFPAVLFDPKGYFVVDSEDSMRSNPYVRVGKQVNVLGGISSIPSYVRCEHTHE